MVKPSRSDARTDSNRADACSSAFASLRRLQKKKREVRSRYQKNKLKQCSFLLQNR